MGTEMKPSWEGGFSLAGAWGGGRRQSPRKLGGGGWGKGSLERTVNQLL